MNHRKLLLLVPVVGFVFWGNVSLVQAVPLNATSNVSVSIDTMSGVLKHDFQLGPGFYGKL
ncbi:hypothetical protein ETB91_12005 [Lacticaseibacillus rhamnosus]|uniref:hypothetical protein n=1 Tax=Lacticaseibacillus rhamnosus TaxID=47715 RepID=UPI001013D215|nr:hypothetical protein [Lacticaseibacillus rhamnosus]RXS53391.1 hypothetical protein ETB91_12005 [Lacticaseibacillus rhamnosus]